MGLLLNLCYNTKAANAASSPTFISRLSSFMRHNYRLLRNWLEIVIGRADIDAQIVISLETVIKIMRTICFG